MSDLNNFIMENGSNTDDYVDYDIFISNNIVFSMPLIDVLEKATECMLVELDDIFAGWGIDFGRFILRHQFFDDIVVFINGDGYFGWTSKFFGTHVAGIETMDMIILYDHTL